MINEEEISKIEKIIADLGYEFQDDRFPDKERLQEIEINKPPHTVLAKNPNNEFHIGFFCFRREKDYSITTREYSHRIENGEVVTDVLDSLSDPIGTSLRYDEIPIKFRNTSFRTGSIENLYKIKQYTNRPKDIAGILILKKYLNINILNQLSNHQDEKILIQNVLPPDLKKQSHSR